MQFVILVQERLESYRFLKINAEDLTKAIIDIKEFQNKKHFFGDPNKLNSSEYRLMISELGLDTSHSSFCNWYQDLKFLRYDVGNSLCFKVNS